MDLGNKNEAFGVYTGDEFLGLRVGNSQLPEHIGEGDVRDRAEIREKIAEILVGSPNFQRLIGEIGGGDGIAEIKKAEIRNPVDILAPLGALADHGSPRRHTIGDTIGQKDFPDWREGTGQQQVAVVDAGEHAADHQSGQECPFRRAIAKDELG